MSVVDVLWGDMSEVEAVCWRPWKHVRGGHVYPELIRNSEKKPIRVFIQEGMNDNRGKRRGGKYDPEWDWYLQNRKMVEALTEKGYDLNYSFGIGTHSNKHGGAMMPEMLRWIWRDYPRPTDDPMDDANRQLLDVKMEAELE